MTLQTSGPISLADIRTEYGVSGSLGMNSCYSGTVGAVPTQFAVSTTVFNGNVPVSGSGSPISFDDFYGGQNIFETTIVSVGVFSTKLSEGQGYNDSGLGEIGNNVYLPNLGANLNQSSSNLFVNYTVNLEVSATNLQFGNQKKEAWTTVTYIADTTVMRIPRSQFTSSTLSVANRSSLFWVGAENSTGIYPQPHTPVGSRVKIRFENNG